MKREKWVWMPRAGHFISVISEHECQFHLCTYVGKYIVSTVGELKYNSDDENFQYIGYNRKYETLVFNAKESLKTCCKYVVKNFNAIDFKGYNDYASATKGHYKLCKKWSKK